MGKEMNRGLAWFANLLFWFHVFWVLYVLAGVVYRFPGVFWTIHLWMSALIIIGVIFDECPLTTFERWVRRKAGKEGIPNRGSRFLEVFYNLTGRSLPNSTMRILGLVYTVLGVSVHFLP